jgi:hypothetical protein
MGATSRAGTANPTGAHEFAPVCLPVLSVVCVVNFVKLHVFTFSVPYCDVRYDFRLKRFSIRRYSHLFCRGFMLYIYICYLSIFICAYWRPTRYPYLMMFVSCNSNMCH